MADVNPALVKQLREKTNAGMMDCKKALVETDGDLEKAEDLLRKKGIASASKKASRSAKEGIVASYIHLQGKVGVLVEVPVMLSVCRFCVATRGWFEPASAGAPAPSAEA